MGTFRVDIVYKIGAVFWAWPAITFLLWSEKPDLDACSFASLFASVLHLTVIRHRPDNSVDHILKMLGYSQAFCFVRVSEVQTNMLKFLHR